jgi:hypothetical protein
MAIRFVDEEEEVKPKSKIRFLDEEPEAAPEAPEPEKYSYGRELVKNLGEEFGSSASGIKDYVKQQEETIFPNTTRTLQENDAEDTSGQSYLKRATVTGPKKLGKTAWAALQDIGSAPLRAAAPLWGESQKDTNAHPLNLAQGKIDEIKSTPLRLGAQTALETGKAVLDPGNLLGGAKAAELLGGAGKLARETRLGQKAVTDYGSGLTKEFAKQAKTTAATKAGQITSKITKPLQNESGSIEIPDLDELAKKMDDEIAGKRAANQILSGKEIKRATGKPIKNRPKSMKDWEATLLTEGLEEQDVPFTSYAEQAIKSSRDRRLPSPEDLAGIRGGQAEKVIGEKLREAGKAKDELFAKVGSNRVDLTDLVDSFEAKIARMGYRVDDAGNIAVKAGRGATNPSELGTVQSLYTQVKRFSANVPAQMADDAKRAINDMVYPSSQPKVFAPSNSVSGSIGKELSKEINDKILEAVGPEYKQINQNYSRLLKIKDEMSRALGEVVDPETGLPRKGASIMKRAVKSNADGGTKALFRAVKDLTGVDLFREGAYATIAMDAVDDPRVADWLEASKDFVTAAASGRPIKGAAAVGKVFADSRKKNRIYEYIDYYNKTQKKMPRK